MLKQDTYLINIASALFKLKLPIYYKLRPKIIANYGSFIAHHNNPNYKLLQDYYKLRQKFITNYSSFITNYCKKILQITTALIFVKFKIITNYIKFYYILRQLLVLLQITANFIRAGITNCNVITNYVVTLVSNNSQYSTCLVFCDCFLKKFTLKEVFYLTQIRVQEIIVQEITQQSIGNNHLFSDGQATRQQ